MSSIELTHPPDRPVWDLAFLTPRRCKLIFVSMLALGIIAQAIFLFYFCPVDLSGDEAQYWDWSRHLDLSYYSKGPLVAYLIRASCSIFGDTMPGVRFPALVLAIGTSCCTYWLTLKLFASHRLALGAFLLQLIVPVYIVGVCLMTIDPPFFFCWALATCLLVKAALDDRPWTFLACGAVVGIGFLAKYAMFLWFPFSLLFLSIDTKSRRYLRTPWPWLMILIGFIFTAPVLIWNARHNWPSLHHVAGQIGANTTDPIEGNTLEFIGSQIGIVNPALFPILIAAIIYALRNRSDPHRRQLIFLLCIGLPFLGVCLLDSLRTKEQANWPVPAYFTLMILAAYFLSLLLANPTRWRRWRGCFYAAIALAFIFQPLLHGSTILYPLAAKFARSHLSPPQFDPAFKLRGIADPFAATVDRNLQTLSPGAFILCAEYSDASQLAFYVPGQPKVYYAGSYWTDPQIRRRMTQFDMWPDRQLDRPELIGKDAIYIGEMDIPPLRESFDSVEKLPDIVIRRDGLIIRSFEAWKCRGFRGMHRPPGNGPY